MEIVYPAIIGLLASLPGVLFQYWLSRRAIIETRRSEQVTKAYADYLLGVARLAHPGRYSVAEAKDKAVSETLAIVADAKSRICLYGDRQVVTALVNFERLGAKIITNEHKKSFASIVLAMRATGALRDTRIAESHVLLLLFGEN